MRNFSLIFQARTHREGCKTDAKNKTPSICTPPLRTPGKQKETTSREKTKKRKIKRSKKNKQKLLKSTEDGSLS